MSPIDRASLALRALTNAAVGATAGSGLGAVGRVVGVSAGLATGALHGRLVAGSGVYPASRRGWLLLVVDHTWSLPNTVAGSIYAAANVARGHTVDDELSRGRTSLVFRERFLRNWRATTIGPVEAGTTPDLAVHEFVHVSQARIFGPLYGAMVVGHYAVATLVPYWWPTHDHERWPIRSVGDYFRRGVYRHVWHEAWAYRVDGTGPATVGGARVRAAARRAEMTT